ncbi:MAG: hypothetical protein IH874_01285 [Candidatus Dadabacteria bacterium]|nr:hypothetical protein [Candidatus Dadabacteria bacterium]
MKIEVRGQIFPKVWDIAQSVRKLREEREVVNIGSGTVCVDVYEVSLPEGTVKDGRFFVTPSGVKLYLNQPDHYEVGYLVSEIDTDPIVSRHFAK